MRCASIPNLNRWRPRSSVTLSTTWKRSSGIACGWFAGLPRFPVGRLIVYVRVVNVDANAAIGDLHTQLVQQAIRDDGREIPDVGLVLGLIVDAALVQRETADTLVVAERAVEAEPAGQMVRVDKLVCTLASS